MRPQKFHGRYDSKGRPCAAPGCGAPGEFRAPSERRPSFDGPGEWRWLCLDHVREFNAGYDWFEGMSAEEIFAAQSPTAGWRTESPAFRPAGVPRCNPARRSRVPGCRTVRETSAGAFALGW